MNKLKLHILFNFEVGGLGGGNHFLTYLKKIFTEKDCYTENVADADILLFNSHHKSKEAVLYKIKYPNKIFVHRVDGPMASQRGALSNRADKHLFSINEEIADATIFQSKYSEKANKDIGMKRRNFERIIYNGADQSIFTNKQGYGFNARKIRLISTVWSNNPNKGYEIYKYIDNNLDFNKYEYLYIGRPPRPFFNKDSADIPFKNIKLIKPLNHKELSAKLQNADIYITASIFDPCSNSLLEALATGIPCIVRNSGGHPELIEKQNQGIAFNGINDILEKIEEVSNNYNKYVNTEYFFNKNYIFDEYYNFFKEIKNRIKQDKKKRLSKFYLLKFFLKKRMFYYLKKKETKIYGNYDHNKKVLILGDSPRATLSVIRSLGENGIYCDLLSFNKKSICFHSRFVRNRFFIDSFCDKKNNWIKELKKILENNYYSLIIPIADKYLIPIWTHYESFEESGRFAIPNKKSIEITFDKAKTIEMAEKLSIPIPKTILIQNLEDLEENRHLLRKLGFPLVVKPVRSYIEYNNKIIPREHSIVNDYKNLNLKIKKKIKYSSVIIQEYIYGDIIGQEFLVKNGEILESFQHIRLHQPLIGGGSTYRKSTPINKKVKEYSEKILKFLNYNGVVMLEYKFLPNTKEKAKLLEINGRFWGSLPLSKKEGINFPLLLYKMYLGEIKEDTKEENRKEVYARYLTGDFMFLLDNMLNQNKKKSEYQYPLLKYVGEFKNLILNRETWDTFSKIDIMPFLYNIKNFILNLIRRF